MSHMDIFASLVFLLIEVGALIWLWISGVRGILIYLLIFCILFNLWRLYLTRKNKD